MSTMLWGEDEGHERRNRWEPEMHTFTDEETERLQRLVAKYEQAQRDGLRPMLGRRTPTPPPWDTHGQVVHWVNPPRARVDWTGLAIAAATFGVLDGLWLAVVWLVFRRLTDG